jgi:hypothetical protein
MPNVFNVRKAGKKLIWTRVFEYRLLRLGIAVHHGKMPAPVARRLKRLIDRGAVRVVIATSTLSEGVNLPVNYILLPSVFRGTSRFELQEFSNLIGRAGRPGVATEGHALVVLPDERGYNRQRLGYEELRDEVERAATAREHEDDAAQSALVAVMKAIESAWRDINRSGTQASFDRWLEETVVATARDSSAVRNLDSLDYFLLCALQEVEQLQQVPLAAADIETELRRIWRATYAFAAGAEEERLSALWLRRGRSIPQLYPDRELRVRIYKTSLTPRSAQVLLAGLPTIIEAIRRGAQYGQWSTEDRFRFIVDVIALLNEVPSFRLSTKLGSSRTFTDWPRVLRWWLCKDTLAAQPTPESITTWFDYVSKNFAYRSAWGLGGVIAVVLNEGEGEPVRPLEIDDWPRAGLPWVAFWLKELLTWGTLEPVAAFLLARGHVKTRPEAERRAVGYYASRPAGTDANGLLDPRLIREWAQENRPREQEPAHREEFEIAITLTRDRPRYRYSVLHVTPIEVNERWTWIDKAGYSVAQSAIIEDLRGRAEQYEFLLNVPQRIVRGRPYLAHRES